MITTRYAEDVGLDADGNPYFLTIPNFEEWITELFKDITDPEGKRKVLVLLETYEFFYDVTNLYKYILEGNFNAAEKLMSKANPVIRDARRIVNTDHDPRNNNLGSSVTANTHVEEIPIAVAWIFLMMGWVKQLRAENILTVQRRNEGIEPEEVYTEEELEKIAEENQDLPEKTSKAVHKYYNKLLQHKKDTTGINAIGRKLKEKKIQESKAAVRHMYIRKSTDSLDKETESTGRRIGPVSGNGRRTWWMKNDYTFLDILDILPRRDIKRKRKKDKWDRR